MMRAVFVAVVTVAALIVANENRNELLTLNVLFGFRTPPVSVALLVLVSFAAGVIATALLVVPAWLRASLKARRQRREIETLDAQRTSQVPAPAPNTANKESESTDV